MGVLGDEYYAAWGHLTPNPHGRELCRGMLIQEAEQPAPGIRRALGRIGRCLLTYLLLHTTAWLIIALLVPWEDSTAQIVRISLGMLAFIGLPTLLLAILASLGHRKMVPGRFRGALVAPMLAFIWPCLAASTAEPLVFELMVQLAFACYLMPVPLLPEK
ncbi:hypothetical protein [Streptomyces sp. NPDC102437]|uniref:hypothetical protein n=1 Tax=Streptomyces sp. NPDC102437 TaxID=3366175 RepID=UPI0037F348B2